MTLRRLPLTRLRKSFTVRVYAALVALLVALTAALTAVSVRAQARLLNEHLHREGRNLADLLAQGGRVRMGVYAENTELLAESADAVAHRPDVVAVAIFGTDGRLLWRSTGASPPAAGSAPPQPPTLPGVGVEEGADGATFWSVVYTREPLSTEEELYLDASHRGPARVAQGRVAVTLSTRQLQASRRAVLWRSAAVAASFLVLAGLLTALVVREATRPLRRLLSRARERWPGAAGGERGDDGGSLTDTFGHLVRTLDAAMARVNELTENLEQRVEERTAELRVANGALAQARDALEERVRERTAELERTHSHLLHSEKLAAVGRLAASIAHEFNNPLFGIRNVLVGLRELPCLTAEDRELTTLAVGECDRVTGLIRDLQGFQRPSAARRSPVDLHKTLDAVLLLCRRELSVKRAVLEKAYAADLPAVWGVEDQLRQVFLNLLTNAMDALGAGGGTIRVSTEVLPGVAAVRVQDDGAGIPAEALGRVFEPFFTTRAEGKGTGLGLSISHGIVASHGGSIEVESRLGRGTAFTVRIPLEGVPPS